MLNTDLENWFGQDKDWSKKLYATLDSSKNVNSYRKKVTRIVVVSKAFAILLVATLLAVFFGRWYTPVSSPPVGEPATILLMVLIWSLIGFILYDMSRTNPQSKLVTYLLKKRRINWDQEFNKRDTLIEVQFPDGLQRSRTYSYKFGSGYLAAPYQVAKQLQTYTRFYIKAKGNELLFLGLTTRYGKGFCIEWFTGKVLKIHRSMPDIEVRGRIELTILDSEGHKKRVFMYLPEELFEYEQRAFCSEMRDRLVEVEETAKAV